MFRAILLSVIFFASNAFAEELNIITTIRPLYSLVSSVTKGTSSKVHLLLGKNDSPHSYALKPSKVDTIYRADLIFIIDNDFEIFLHKILKNIADNARIYEMAKIKGISLLKNRENNLWSNGSSGHGGGDHHDHVHHESDFHIWLDSDNAITMVYSIANTLSRNDPGNAKAYFDNAKKTVSRIYDLNSKVRKKTRKVKSDPYLVFHDAYQYFEKKYDLSSVGSITVIPPFNPSAKALMDLKNIIRRKSVKCIFCEPQFAPKILIQLSQDSGVPIGELDPIWGDNDAKPEDAYFALLEKLASNLGNCLHTKLDK